MLLMHRLNHSQLCIRNFALTWKCHGKKERRLFSVYVIGFYWIIMGLYLIFWEYYPDPRKVSKPVCSVINQPLIDSTANTIPIRSSEAERGFSQINTTMTSERNKLIINNVSALSLISVNESPLRTLTTW